jgi:putative ABC transport system permease protein
MTMNLYTLKFALRSLGKYKMYTLVNLLGLTLGLTAALLIAMYVTDELSFDRYHEKSEQIYQLIAERSIPGRGSMQSATLPAPLAAQLANGFPEIENYFRGVQLGRADLSYNNNAYYELVLAADPEIFELLDFTFLEGDAETALSNLFGVVMTESTARKYFGDEPALGKTVTGSRGENVVTAVIADMPGNSHLQFNVLFPFPPYLNMFMPDWANNWDISAFFNYLQIAPDTDLADLETRLTRFLQSSTPLESSEGYTLSLLPITDIHLNSGQISGQWNANPGNIETVYTLEAIAIFLLLIACINYTSLATARSANRAHEISLRKMMGAQSNGLMLQFLIEAILLTCAAAVLALTLVQMLIPLVNSLSGKALAVDFFLQADVLVLTLAGVLLLGVAAGAYPAFMLSHQQITRGLADQRDAGKSAGILRKSLVLAQFVLSVVLVFCTLVVAQQMRYVQSKSLGFDENNVIAIDINSQSIRVNAEAIRNEFLQHPNVQAVSTSSRLPGDWKSISRFSSNVVGRDSNQALETSFITADESFLETFSIALLEGVNLSPLLPDNSVLINETMAARMNTDSVLGQQLAIEGTVASSGVNAQATVVGVVADFHFESLHQSIAPLVIGKPELQLTAIDYYSVRAQGGDLNDTIAHLREVMQRHDPVTPFEYNILSAQIDTFYDSDRTTALLFSVAAGMAIFIACMGLFGLSSYATEQRNKEVGIRKVLGASVAAIVHLLSADFMKPVLLAVVIALPFGYYLMTLWLQSFAYYISIGLGTFLLSALLAILVSLATVSVQSVRAALRNPVESIAYE